MTPDVFCPCGCKEGYRPEPLESRCRNCREILPNNFTGSRHHSFPYMRESDWKGAGAIVECFMEKLNELDNQKKVDDANT